MSSTFDSVADEYGIDKNTKNYAKQGKARVRRKNAIKEACVPPHVLDNAGFNVPGSVFNPEKAREYPTTKHCEGSDGETTTVHLHQDVREDMGDSFGDFGAVADDTDDVVWTVVDLTDGTVTLTVVGEWGKRREVAYSDFAADYEPQCLADGQPKWGY